MSYHFNRKLWGLSIKPVGYIVTMTLWLLSSGCHHDAPLLLDAPINTISQQLDQLTPALMDKHDVMGLSIGLVRDGRLVLTHSYGYADAASGRKIDRSTVYKAASLGKPVFAYLVMALVRQGIIDLDRPLYLYHDQYLVEGDARSKKVTARMVLSHTTGVPNFNGSAEAVFEFEPGSRFEYSGHAYQYLQRVIEKLTAKDLQQLAHSLVFAPLVMTNSSYVWQEKYTGLISTSYQQDRKPYQAKQARATPNAAFSLYTTVEDYARFVIHIMDNASDPDSIAASIIEPEVAVAKGVEWGLGWGLQTTTPHRSFWHWGSLNGFRHYVVGYPVQKSAVVVMTNSNQAFRMVDDVMAMSLGGSFPSYEWF